jgi:hypothetical protein
MAARFPSVYSIARSVWNAIPLTSRLVTPSGGSIASVTGSVGSVTGAVGSVTGAVGSVTAPVAAILGIKHLNVSFGTGEGPTKASDITSLGATSAEEIILIPHGPLRANAVSGVHEVVARVASTTQVMFEKVLVGGGSGGYAASTHYFTVIRVKR